MRTVRGGRGIVTARIAGPLHGPARAGPGCLAYFWSLRTCLLSGHQALRVEGAFRVAQAEEPGDGAAAGTVRSSAICFLQEGRKRAQPRRADGGLRGSNEQ